MVVAVEDLGEIDELAPIKQDQESVDKLLREIFPQLAKLNPQGTIHAKTLYSGINVVCRVTPGAVFASLASNPAFLSMGDNYWLLRK